MPDKCRSVVEMPHLEIIAEQEFGEVAFDELTETDEYQRDFSLAKAKAMSKGLQPLAARELVVSVRSDGTKVVIDGRHTKKALLLKGYTEWRAQLLYGLTLAEESRLFWYLNTRRANPMAIETWKSRRVFKDPVVLGVERICKKCGFTIRKAPGLGRTKAVATLEKVYGHGNGVDDLEATLLLARESWPEDPRHGEGRVLLGIAVFLDKTGLDPGKHHELRRKWSCVSLDTILHRAKSITQFDGVHSSTATAYSLLEAYNKGRSSRKVKFVSNGRAS